MCLGVFDVNASADHVTFSQGSKAIKPASSKAFMRKIAFFYPLNLQKIAFSLGKIGTDQPQLTEIEEESSPLNA